MDPSLRELLYEISGGPCNDSTYTHVTTADQQTNWAIKPQHHSSFWPSYCDLVETDAELEKEEGKDLNLCLAERNQDIMPLVSNLTFKFDCGEDDENWEPYDDFFLCKLCYTYQSAVEEFFQVTSETKTELVVVVLESSHWFEERGDQKLMFLQVRIQFPYCKIEAPNQSKYIRPRVIQMLRNTNALSLMQRQPVGDWEQIISATAESEPLSLYGSTKTAGAPKLKITHIWPAISADMFEEGCAPQDIDLEDAFTPGNHSHVQQRTMRVDLLEERDDPVYWLPMFLSINYWPLVILPKKLVQRKQEQTQSTHIFGASKKHHSSENSELELAERMLQMIDTQRFFKESLWTDIGKALYTSDLGGEHGLNAWIRHSSKAVQDRVPDFMTVAGSLEDTCRNMYYMFDKSNTTVKTLAWYAKEDAPEKYSSWHKEWYVPSMEKALSALHTDVAEALYRVYWLDFVYCSLGKGTWYQFKQNRWTRMNQALDLRKNISEDFLKKFEEVRYNLSKQIHDSDDESFRSNGETTLKKLTALMAKLKTSPFKSSIVTEVSVNFKQDNFSELMDTNANITGIANGVLEAIGDQIVFRQAKPEDYVSMVSPVSYHKLYSWEHPLVKECLEWMQKVFPDTQLLHHFLKFAASCLKGRNSDKIFPIFSGSGDNSKSMIVKLFENVFGPYCVKFPISMISEKAMSSSGPTPQLARARGAKVAFLDEGDDNVALNKNTIKRFTGGDSFYARMLHDNGGEIQATFKMVLTCNNIPSFANPDKPIKNRVRVFPYLAKFVDDPPETKEEQFKKRLFKKDPFFERRIPILAPAFLWIMTKYYPRYIRDGLVDPALVTETTEQYWKETDVYSQFIVDNIREHILETGERDPDYRTNLSDIYSEFKVWFRDAFPGAKVPERSTVRSELSTRWGRMQGNWWVGVTLSTVASGDMTAQLGGKKLVKPDVEKPPQPPMLKIIDAPFSPRLALI